MRERIQGDQKFKQLQHKDSHDQHHTTHLEMRVKVIYSLKSVIYRDGGKIQPYSKTLDSSPGMFTSLKEIQAYIEECEQKRLDLDNEEVWSKAYLPATRKTEVGGNYEGKVVFRHVQIRLVAPNGLWTTARLVKK